MGLKSMHAEKQSEQPQQSVQDNSLIEQQSQRIAELMKGQEQDSYLIEQQSQKIAELERHISQITQQSQKKDSQISEAISQAEEWKARADQERKVFLGSFTAIVGVPYAEAQGIPFMNVINIMLGITAVNGIPEAIVSGLIITPIVMALHRAGLKVA